MVALVASRVASGLQWLHLGLQPDATILTYKTKNGAATAEVYHSGSHSPNFLYSVVAIHFLNSTRISSLLYTVTLSTSTPHSSSSNSVSGPKSLTLLIKASIRLTRL